jgi:hypothetical protein
VVLHDPLDITSWEKKIERMEKEEEKCITRIDKDIETTVESINVSKDQDNKNLFSNYLGSVNQKKNILLNKIDTIINAYDNERKRKKYEVTLDEVHFSKISTKSKGKDKYSEEAAVHAHKKIILLFGK